MSLIIHHFLPFLLIFMLALSIVKSFLVGYAGKDLCLQKCKILSITMILAHLQLVFGIILFYKKSSEILDWSVVMSNTDSRYTFIEHPLMMLLAIILISVGRVKAKKIEDSKKSAKTIFIYFFIALILILIRTPDFYQQKLLFLILLLGLIVFMIVSMWKVFEKSGEPGWASIVPIYNMIVMCRIARKPGWWVILQIIPCLGIIWSIWVINRIAKGFGKDESFTLGLIFLPFIFCPMLGFGDAEYQPERLAF